LLLLLSQTANALMLLLILMATLLVVVVVPPAVAVSDGRLVVADLVVPMVIGKHRFHSNILFLLLG
jgi:hypothetical protein